MARATIPCLLPYLCTVGVTAVVAAAGTFSGVVAAGSYGNSLSLYSEDTGAAVVHVGAGGGGVPFGVTCVRWSPCGTCLWAGGRKHDDLVCWDLRRPDVELGRPHSHSHTHTHSTV